MTTYKRPRGFLKSIGLGKASKFVDAEIYRLVDHLPQYEDEYSDEDGLMSVYDEIHLDYKSESKEQACTASFLKEVSKAIMAKRPATALHMLDSGSLYIPTADLQKITSDAVKAFESRGIYGFYRTSAVISYLRRVFKRYEDVPWPTDRLEPLYLTALVHEGVEELRLEGDCQHQQVAKEFDYLIRCLREAEPNMVDFFRALADAPQEAVEAGECKPEKAIRRRALVNRFFGIVMERGTSVDLLGDNPLCLKNMLKLIEDGPKRLEPPQSLATEYDNREFREVLALKQLSVIHTRGYLQGRTGSDMVANLSSFTSIVDDAKYDLQLTAKISELLVETHPDTSFLLLSMTTGHKTPDHFTNFRYQADFIDRLDARIDPGLFEFRAIMNLTRGLSHSYEATRVDRDQMTLLIAGERILYDLESQGLDCVDLRKDFDLAAQGHMDYGKQAYDAYIGFYGKGSIRSLKPYEKPHDYEIEVNRHVNPLFRLMLAHGHSRNHMGKSLTAFLNTFQQMLKNIKGDRESGEQAWLYDAEAPLLSGDPNKVIELMLKSFSVPARSLTFSLQGNNVSKFSLTDATTEVNEAAKLRSLNESLREYSHDAELRRAAYTNLLTAVVRLAAGEMHKFDGKLEMFDGLLLEIIPYADVEKVSKDLTESENVILGGVIVRHKPEMHKIVPLTSRGKIFSNELGI